MSARYRVVAPPELDADLTHAWQALQSSSEAFSNPYFCPQFTRLAGEVRDDVHVVVVEDGSRPVAFFPYQRSALGFGRPVGGSLSDYHGVVALPGSEWCVPDLLRAADLMTWKFDHLVDPCGKFEPYISAQATSPQIDLRAGYEGYAKARREAGSDVMRKTEQKARKLAREHGEVVFTLHDNKPDVWDCLFRWKGAQYRRTGITDPFGFRWTRALLQRICAVDSPDFAGVLSSLRVGDKVAAVHMGMRSRDVLHWWFSTYDPDPAYAKYSIGMILLLRAVQAFADRGIRMIDLGEGDAFYKQRVMTGSTPLREGSIGRRPWLGPLARAREVAVKVIRRIQQHWRFC
jgi:CelD/BcsL family acetyltransferase involved in cellulose biosynthesis